MVVSSGAFFTSTPACAELRSLADPATSYFGRLRETIVDSFQSPRDPRDSRRADISSGRG